MQVGELLSGKYRLVRALGEGAMGSVFVAHNEALDIEVAVKVVRADIKNADDARLAARLRQEAQVAAQIGHPAILRVHDFGTAPGGDPFLVMELLQGEDLSDALDRRGRVSPAKSARILLPIAHALAVAHEKGVVHRDLKPDNIFLSQRDRRIQPMIIDFGVARLRDRGGLRITQLGAAVGTPDYMAPEQAMGHDVDERADIWAFCVVLYEMVTGQRPFQGSNNFHLLRSITKDEPKPISELGVRDPELSAIVQHGLAKDPEERWRSMRALGLALARWLLDRGVTEDVCGASLEAMWIYASPVGRHEDAFGSIPPPAADGEARVSAGDPAVGAKLPSSSTPKGEDRLAELDTTPSPRAGSGKGGITEEQRWGRRVAVLGAALFSVLMVGLAGWQLSRSSDEAAVAPERSTAPTRHSTAAAAPCASPPQLAASLSTNEAEPALSAPTAAATAVASAEPTAVAAAASTTQGAPESAPPPGSPRRLPPKPAALEKPIYDTNQHTIVPDDI